MTELIRNPKSFVYIHHSSADIETLPVSFCMLASAYSENLVMHEHKSRLLVVNLTFCVHGPCRTPGQQLGFDMVFCVCKQSLDVLIGQLRRRPKPLMDCLAS